MPLIRGHHSFDDHFTQIPNDWVRDTRLSLKAIGLLAQIMSHTPGWRMSIRSLARVNGTGQDTIKSAILELEQFGYLVRSEKQGHNEDGTFADYDFRTQDPFQNPVTGKSRYGESGHKEEHNSLEEQVSKNNERKPRKLFSIDHELPEDWQPNENLMEMFKTKWPHLNPSYNIEQFRLYYLAKGTKHKNWDLTFQKWMNTEEQRAIEQPWRYGSSNSASAQGKKEKERKFTDEFLSEMQELEKQAAPAPKCPHGNNIALCRQCLR
jgi:hypothetical protein